MTGKNVYDILDERGFVHQSTDPDVLRERLAAGPTVFYAGFDPTASSLHVGHLLPVMAMRWLARCGHRPIALVGGGTGMIGDPSGKTEARRLLEGREVAENAAALGLQLRRVIGSDSLIAVDNADWLAPLKYLDFLRDYGRLFSVNRMLAMESVRQRLETGMTFLEFNYMLLQAYDYLVLSRDYGCDLQLGGSDQWGNIVAGVDLVRRVGRREVHALTLPLLLKSDGEKFGKSSGGAVWLNPELTSPFEYYQFWRNAEDAEVGRLLALFTELPMAEVKRLGGLAPPEVNRGKEILGFEATRLVHGEDEAARAWLAAGREFGFADPDGLIDTSSGITEVSGTDTEAELPTIHLSKKQMEQRPELKKLLAILVVLSSELKLGGSRGEARRLIRGGGCYIDDDRVSDENAEVPDEKIEAGEFILRAGKKKRVRVVVTA